MIRYCYGTTFLPSTERIYSEELSSMMRTESQEDDCNSDSGQISEIPIELIPQTIPVLFVTSQGLHVRTKKKQSPPTSDSGQGTSSSLENTSNRNLYDFKFCDLERSWVSYTVKVFSYSVDH